VSQPLSDIPQRLIMPGIEKRPPGLHHLSAVAGIARPLELHR
jgi:hypothetical protein